MTIHELRASLDNEVATILSSDFSVNVTATSVVPHSDDAGITFPNLDEKRQSCKLIDTCILYIDIRRSTELNLSHRPKTVARLYSSFVRAMTRAARFYDGHVRGIIGDRVMVLFDTHDAYTKAVNCAILMNSVAIFVINKHFKANEVTCGIGIDAGKMLVTKTGIRKNGQARQSYRNLVWLGRPANVASKLTDLANKPPELANLTMVGAGYTKSALFDDGKLEWRTEFPWDFVRKLSSQDVPFGLLRHVDPSYRWMYTTVESHPITDPTPPILLTRVVFDGFKAANPNADVIVNGWFAPVSVSVPGFSDLVYGGAVHKSAFEGA